MRENKLWASVEVKGATDKVEEDEIETKKALALAAKLFAFHELPLLLLLLTALEKRARRILFFKYRIKPQA